MDCVWTIDRGDDVELADRIVLPIFSDDLDAVFLLIERSEAAI